MEHSENNSYKEPNPHKKPLSLTTVIAIKCKEGVILASDSQGSTPMLKFNVRKLFNLGSNITLGCAGDGYDIDTFIEELKHCIAISESNMFVDFDDKINFFLQKMNKEYNIRGSSNNGFNIPISLLKVEGLLMRKYNSNIYIYYLGFKEHEKGVNSYINKIINDFITIGSGYQIAHFVLSQQEKIHNTISGKKLFDLNLETNIGTALYVLNEVKSFNFYTGGDTQIVISNKEGSIEIPIREHQKYYNIFIDNLSELFGKDLTDVTKNKEILKKIFPVSQTTFL